MLHIILVLWIPGNMKDSSLKGQEAARCYPQAHKRREGWLRLRGLWVRAPHLSSSGPSHQAFSYRHTSPPSCSAPLPTRLAEVYSDATFSIKSLCNLFSNYFRLTRMTFYYTLWVFPHWSYKLLEGRDQVLASLFSRWPSRAFCARSNKCLIN